MDAMRRRHQRQLTTIHKNLMTLENDMRVSRLYKDALAAGAIRSGTSPAAMRLRLTRIKANAAGAIGKDDSLSGLKKRLSRIRASVGRRR